MPYVEPFYAPGWVCPKGRFWPCGEKDHEQVAFDILNDLRGIVPDEDQDQRYSLGSEQELETLGYFRVSIAPDVTPAWGFIAGSAARRITERQTSTVNRIIKAAEWAGPKGRVIAKSLKTSLEDLITSRR